MTFATTIRDRRLELGFTQARLGVLCGCTVDTISSIERGVHVPRRASLILALAEHLQLEHKAILVLAAAERVPPRGKPAT